MKKRIKILIILLLPVLAYAQTSAADADGKRYQVCFKAYNFFIEKNRDTAMYYANQCINLARKNNKQLALANMLDARAYQFTGSGRYADALRDLLEAFEIGNDPRNAVPGWMEYYGSDPERIRLIVLSFTHHVYGILMERTHNIEQEMLHYQISKRIGRQIGFKGRIQYADMHMGPTYVELGKLDSALITINEARDLAIKAKDHQYLGNILSCLGDISFKKGEMNEARKYYNKAAAEDLANGNISDLTNNYLKITNFYLAAGQRDSSLHYAQKALKYFKTLGPTALLKVNIGVTYENLYKSYELYGQTDSAYKYSVLTLRAKDSLNKGGLASLSEFQSLLLKEQIRLQELEKEKVIYQSRIRSYAMLAGLIVLLAIALIFYRNNLHRKKANLVLENTLNDLKSAQNQLILKEKMASLGELTAGIAHEIQNPLNFVNNFSEVNREMLEELKAESTKPKAERDEALEKDLLSDLIENEEKINHHGKRAESIIKGMLEHSRAGSGEKQVTDLNVLTDEFMKLSYHGFRAKNKDFNAELITNFDGKLPKVNVIPQDIGRVMLNLFNNAFYAVNQKQKTAGEDYKPEVSVSTSSENGRVTIKVKDNGTGIPEAIKEKIMQPFFTTKPTGEGTGLGLSLTYDMVVKGHGGSIQINSKAEEGSEFIIQLPVAANKKNN